MPPSDLFFALTLLFLHSKNAPYLGSNALYLCGAYGHPLAFWFLCFGLNCGQFFPYKLWPRIRTPEESADLSASMLYNGVFRNRAIVLENSRLFPRCFHLTVKGTPMTNPLFQKDIISISEFTRDHLELVLQTARSLKEHPRNDLLQGKLIGVTFFEGSTRTRLSFETAIHRLGGQVIGFADAANTSLGKKGETLADSIRIITSYTDALVMRHHMEGAARLAADLSPVPVLNAGDGANQHPSQTILDLFTIYETQGHVDDLKIAFVGDLKYGRTVHSLAEALSMYRNVHIYLVSPESLAMPDYILEHLKKHNVTFSIHPTIEEVIPEVDILYMTRVQKERFDETEYQNLRSKFILSKDMLSEAKSNMKILHPLPRIDEITLDVDDTPHAYFFQQAANGVYARQALLALVLNKEL